MAAIALTCGDAACPGAGAEVRAVQARPERGDVDPVLSALDGRRLVVCWTDADLAAVVLRLLRTGRLAAVPVGYGPASARSAVAALWGLPPSPAAAASLALRGEADQVPLIRDDAGGVLLGSGVLRPVRGVACCDSELLLRGRASRLEVAPDPAHGLVVRVVRRGLLGRWVQMAAGRAVQLGCLPTACSVTASRWP